MKLDEDIRHLFYVEKLSQRAIAKKLGISRNTVRRYCTAEKTSDMRKVRSYDCPVTGPIKEKVKMWLDEENTTSPKKRLTSEQIYQRLVQEGFSGGASTVRKLVHELRFGNKQNIESLYEEFLRVVTAGKGYQGIADLLANKLQVSILIEDEYFRVLARSRFNADFEHAVEKKSGKKYWKPQRVDPRISYYVSLSQKTASPIELPELPEYGVKQSRQVFPIFINNSLKGYLHVFKKYLDKEQKNVVKAALHGLTVLEACREAQLELRDSIKKSIIMGLISSDKDQASFLQEQKQILGFDLSKETVLAIVQIDNLPRQFKLEDVINSVISDLAITASATAVNEQQVVLLIQDFNDNNRLEPSVVENTLQELYEALKMILGECKIKIGVGRQCLKAREYKIAYAEAQKALSSAGLGGKQEEGVIYYHSLGLIGFLQQTGNELTLPLFVREKLGALYEYSVRHNIDLIGTLGSFLEHDCSILSTARELFIHPNTLRYRIKKAESIAGVDLKDRDHKLELQLAIKLYRFYGDMLFKN